MAQTDAVRAVSGELFEQGWSRVRGSMQGLHQQRQQMCRAAVGHRAAVFKAIRGGGTHTRKQLSNQLHYLTTKSSHIVDSRGTFDGKKQLNSHEIKSLTNRFAKRWDEGFNPKLGNTTHMLMSFPIGTKGTDVRDVSSAVAERFFKNDERNFDYIIAVHEDRDHPHAHIVLNRRSQEGELFYLGRDHHFNYDDFRLAMVEEAERVGVKLEATRRIHRGVVDYAPRAREVYNAKEESRPARQRERFGSDQDRVLAEVHATSAVYRSLAAEANDENRDDLENALLRASAILARGGRLEPEGDVYMATEQSFDDLNTRFTQQVQRVSKMIEDAPEGRKAAMQRQLSNALQGVAHMSPIGVRSSTLTQPPSATGVYSERNINEGLVGKLRDGSTRAQVETALRGTGISSAAVIDRIEQGANNAALEREWYADDLQKIAETKGLNLEKNEDLRVAVDELDRTHADLGVALERAEVLRRDGVSQEAPEATFHYDADSVDDMSRAVRQDLRDQGFSEAEIAERADEIEVRAEARLEAEQREYLANHPEILARPTDVVDVNDPTSVRIVDQDRADQIDREIEGIMQRADGQVDVDVAVAADFKERYPDMPDHLAKGLATTYVVSFSANNREAMRESELEEARIADGREAVSQDLALNAGIEQAERDGIAAQNEVLSYADRQELEKIERIFSTTDFNYGYADYGPARREGEAEVRRASELFSEYAARSPAHAAEVSRAWDEATDIVRPPEEYVSENSRMDVKLDDATAYRNAHPELPIPSRVFPPNKDGELFVSSTGAYKMDAALNERFGTEPRTQAEYDVALAREYPDMPQNLRSELARDYSEFRKAEPGIIERDGSPIVFSSASRVTLDPEIKRVIDHEKTDRINSPFGTDEAGAAYRERIENELGDEQVEALKLGDADALDEVIDDRLDRLYAAKAYLQSDEATANSEAVREVVSEINEEEFEAQRLKSVASHTEKGQTHG